MRYRTGESYSVYALWNREEVVYIGMTNNLQRRIQQHEQRKRFSIAGNGDTFIWTDFTSSCVAEEGDEFTAKCIERELIGEFRPKHNAQVGKSSKYSYELCRACTNRLLAVDGGTGSEFREFVSALSKSLNCKRNLW